MRQKRAAKTDDPVRDGAARLLARSPEKRALDTMAILPRVRATVEKYLLSNTPEASPPQIARFIDGLHAEELVLVVACERGDEAAWSELMEKYWATVLSAARGASANEAEAVELAQSVWAELYGLRELNNGRASGKLAYYSGCGSLGGWLRAVVGQLGVDRHRKSSRLVQTEDNAEFDRMVEREAHGGDGFRVAPAPDPERFLAETESARAVHRALAQAISELDAEDRLLIKLYYFDDLRLREAGAVLGVHEATASRRLTRLHAEIRRRVEALLVSEHGWTREDVARSLTEVGMHLETDIRQALTVETASGEQPRSDDR